jgi:hypothetical protein
MYLKIVLFLCLHLGVAGAASAWECTAHTHRYFVRCDEAGCRAAFRVIEVPAGKPCGRRPVVDDIDARDAKVLGDAVASAPGGPARGLYQFALTTYLDAPVVSAEMVVGASARQAGMVTLVRVTPGATAPMAQAARRAYEAEAGSAAFGHALRLALSWAGAAIVLLTLLRALMFYLVRTGARGARAAANPWSVPVTIQFTLALAAIAVVIVVGMVGPFHLYWGTPAPIPFAGLIVLCEAWAWARHGWQTRRARLGAARPSP